MTFESENEPQPPPAPEADQRPTRDRKLGDEWEDWDGTQEGEIDEPQGRFILLASFVCLGLIGFLLGIAYLAEPRVNEWPPALRWGAQVVFFGLLGAGICCYGLVLIELITGKVSFLPYRWSEGVLLWLLPKATWIGGKIGLSRDRVANSFIKANNALTRSKNRQIRRPRLLILLPRCLSKSTRQDIRRLTEGHPYSVATAGGGEEARKAIRQERPSFIIALACERDLVSGIRDVALHVPVIGIPNKRPEGPCKNTYIDLQEFQQALDFFENAQRPQCEEAQQRS
jgi:uncharacterized protein